MVSSIFVVHVLCNHCRLWMQRQRWRRQRWRDLWPFSMLDVEFNFTICGLGPLAQGHKREKLPSIIASSWKTLVTKFAWIWLFACMSRQVCVKITHCCKILITCTTLMRFFTCVSHHLYFLIIIGCKICSTNFALIRLFHLYGSPCEY